MSDTLPLATSASGRAPPNLPLPESLPFFRPSKPFIPPLGTPPWAKSLDLPPHHTPLHGNLPFSPRTDANPGYFPGESLTQLGGLGSNYTGYPTDLPSAPSSDSHSHPNTPGTRPAEMHGSLPGYGMGTPYRTPMSLYPPPHPAAYAPSPHPGSWPVPPMGTPYEPPSREIPMLYSPPSGYPLPPTQSGGAFDMSAMGEASDGLDGSEPEIDLISRWAAGDHYGPVLEPFLTHVLNIKVLVNPLLSPPTPDSDL
ncbi:hypothetical protein V5O48_015335, partial [Marasmius crinis-equi]